MSLVLVTGTGRCGTVTFARACEFVHGYTVSHESKAGRLDIDYPDDHIEVDPHLFWKIPDLLDRYPDALWVILDRERGALINSIAARATMPDWGQLAFQGPDLDRMVLAKRFIDFVHGILPSLLPDALYLRTPVSESEWRMFLNDIGAEADVKALTVLQTVHNATKGPRR